MKRHARLPAAIDVARNGDVADLVNGAVAIHGNRARGRYRNVRLAAVADEVVHFLFVVEGVAGVDGCAAQGHAGRFRVAAVFAACLAAIEPDRCNHAVIGIHGHETVFRRRAVGMRLDRLGPASAAIERLCHHDMVGVGQGTRHLEPVCNPVLIAERRDGGQVGPVDEHVLPAHDGDSGLPARVRQGGVPERRPGFVRLHPAQDEGLTGTACEAGSGRLRAGRNGEGICRRLRWCVGCRAASEECHQYQF